MSPTLIWAHRCDGTDLWFRGHLPEAAAHAAVVLSAELPAGALPAAALAGASPVGVPPAGSPDAVATGYVAGLDEFA